MKKFLIALLAVGMVACDGQDKIGGESGDGHKGPGTYTVKGKVEKGPFISGSTINLQPMNENLQPVGSTFSTTITDNAGNFSFNPAQLDEPYAQLTANGYFFNEVEGKLSNGTLTLRALADLSEQSTVNVNILTHLKYARILDLVEKDGKSYADANIQAQMELMRTFGFEKFNNANVSDFNITSGTEEASALLAISSLILYGKSEAGVTEFLATLCDEFGKDGIFSVHSQERLRQNRNNLAQKLDAIAENVVKRYAELGDTITVLPLKYQFDWNDDGIAGNELSNEFTEVELSDSVVHVPYMGGEFTVSVNCGLDLFLSAQVKGDDDELSIYNPYVSIYDPSYRMDTPFSKELSNGKLRISVGQSNFATEQYFAVPLYDFFGTEVARVKVVQEPNPDPVIPMLGQAGAEGVMRYFEEMSNIMLSMSTVTNGLYGPLNNERKKVDMFGMRAPDKASDNMAESIYRSSYQALNIIMRLESVDRVQMNVYGPFCTVWKALIYYNMCTLWGDIPYYWESLPTNLSSGMSRTAVNDVLNDLATRLLAAIDALPYVRSDYYSNIAPREKNRDPSKWSDFLFASKDIANMLLADIYMFQGKHDLALPLLETICSEEGGDVRGGAGVRGRYVLSSDCFMLDRETFLGFFNFNTGIEGWRDWNYIPVFTLSDALLSKAECLYFTGSERDAWDIVTGGVIDVSEAGIYGGVAGEKGTYDRIPLLYDRMLECTDDLLEVIDDIRFASMRSTVGRFAYLKRVGKAESIMGLLPFQTLWPIPSSEVFYWGQNPGY